MSIFPSLYGSNALAMDAYKDLNQLMNAKDVLYVLSACG